MSKKHAIRYVATADFLSFKRGDKLENEKEIEQLIVNYPQFINAVKVKEAKND